MPVAAHAGGDAKSPPTPEKQPQQPQGTGENWASPASSTRSTDCTRAGYENQSPLTERSNCSTPAVKLKVVYETEIEQLGLRGFLEARCLADGSSLSTLRLDDNSLGTEGARVLREVLSQCAQLNRLSLVRTALDSDAFVEVGGLLEEAPGQSLSTLLLCGNRPCGGGPMSCDVGDKPPPPAFCQGLSKVTSLQALHMSHCALSSTTLGPICGALCKGTAPLQRLNLSYNRLDGSAVSGLCSLLQAKGTLVQLDLSANALGPKGGEMLADGLQKQIAHEHGVKRLTVDRNELGIRGCSALLRLWEATASWSADTAPRQLELLDLRDNGTTAQQCEEFCRFLHKPFMAKLDFDGGRRQVLLSWHDRSQGKVVRRGPAGQDTVNVFWHS
eukprot:gnl/TRDRNA2_/TRDRNA2_129624_c0_seq1.p1 gnl/TRDRNA2_/TRDRNA2_129624_c0~~gnl/TRDRNA2_/TRDRNA2_129624_c0_seq1.p1  ORF type:complete len:387 (-),score=52.49 gnl/TRDRNA2_/TRDRNA2_129624_c0_seq1:59-1219(-)